MLESVCAEDRRHRSHRDWSRLLSVPCAFPVPPLFGPSSLVNYSAGGGPRVYQGLSIRRWSWPLHGATALFAVTALLAVGRRRFRLARLAAAAQVALVVLGWGASQYPFVVVPDLTLAAASAPRVTQTLLLGALAAGALVLFPSLRLLFRVFKARPR